ncbi:MAG TPA: DNA polymerase IV [Anaerolineales bacterium]|nr:DNA polymerase IV [Anaerolineales bacterium]
MDNKANLRRKIIHLDLDAFFCAVEELRDPGLRGRPFAVGGSPDGRGVVATCSYAARKFGIHSAMAMARALRLCPHLVIVHHHFKDYTQFSAQVMDLVSTYSPLVQPISIDEAFIDITHSPEEGAFYAKKLQAEIRDRLGLPCSLGVASNKLVAKVATNVGKAAHKMGGYPNAIQVVPPGEEAAFLSPLPSDALWGVGPKTAERLAGIGVHTVGDIAAYPLRELERHFGQSGADLHRRAYGIDDSPVHISHETKSVSQEETFPRDLNDEKQLRAVIREQAQSVARRLRRLELYGGTVKLKLRWPDFTTITRQNTLAKPTDHPQQIEAMALDLFQKNWKPGRKIRLLGVGVSNLSPAGQQLVLWDWNPKDAAKQERLQDAIDSLQARYGEAALSKASKLQVKS